MDHTTDSSLNANTARCWGCGGHSTGGAPCLEAAGSAERKAFVSVSRRRLARLGMGKRGTQAVTLQLGPSLVSVTEED